MTEPAATTPGLVPASTALSRPADHPWANDKTGWVHEDGTPCPEYIAPDNGTRWWCTEHEKYLKPPGTGTPAATTPGRAAYEAFCRLFPYESWGPWESLEHSDCDDRPHWEEIAQAAIAAHPVVALMGVKRDAALREGRELRRQMDDLHRERDSLTGLVRDLRGLIRHWRAEAASWDGFTVAGDDARNTGFAERAARYAECADAAEALLGGSPDGGGGRKAS